MKGIPGLDTRVHEAEHGMKGIAVQERTFADLGLNFDLLGLAVIMRKKGGTRLHAFEDADQAFPDVMLASQKARPSFFRFLGGGQVLDGTPKPFCFRERRLKHFFGLGKAMVPKIFAQNIVGVEKCFHPRAIGEGAKMPTKNQPIKTVQNTKDKFGKGAYKRLHGCFSFAVRMS